MFGGRNGGPIGEIQSALSVAALMPGERVRCPPGVKVKIELKWMNIISRSYHHIRTEFFLFFFLFVQAS